MSRVAGGAILAALAASPAAGQDRRAEVLRERAAYEQWLASSPVSPRRAIARPVIGDGLLLGPGSGDVPLAGIAPARLVEAGGTLRLSQDGVTRTLPRGRETVLGAYRLVPVGRPGRTVVAIYGAELRGKAPGWYEYDPTLVLEAPLEPPATPGRVRVGTVDGLEAEAAEAGTFAGTLAGTGFRFTVRRIPADAEDADLEIYFRDATNGVGTYDAGRFVTLEPLGNGRYRLDFNRARNPFCAYSSAFPCPAPWRGNAVTLPVTAGERYAGGGLPVAVPGSRE